MEDAVGFQERQSQVITQEGEGIKVPSPRELQLGRGERVVRLRRAFTRGLRLHARKSLAIWIRARTHQGEEIREIPELCNQFSISAPSRGNVKVLGGTARSDQPINKAERPVLCRIWAPPQQAKARGERGHGGGSSRPSRQRASRFSEQPYLGPKTPAAGHSAGKHQGTGPAKGREHVQERNGRSTGGAK